MYTDFYHFKEKPFSLTPDPRFLYLSKQHQGALDHLIYGISQREGFMVIAGGIGTGKTTVCRYLLGNLDEKVRVALILNPILSARDLLRTLLDDLGVKPPSLVSQASQTSQTSQVSQAVTSPQSRKLLALGRKNRSTQGSGWGQSTSKKELLDALNDFLLQQNAAGGSTVLIIDEAQDLTLEVMEQIRLLSNMETEKEKLLQIVFFGQKELNQKLRLPELKQLNQRVSIRYEIAPLSFEETGNYIQHRLMHVSRVPRGVFAHPAIDEVYAYSQGYPRLINLVCDRALLAGHNEQSATIKARHVKYGIQSLLGEDHREGLWTHLFRWRWTAVVLILAASILIFGKYVKSFSFPEVTSAAQVFSKKQDKDLSRATKPMAGKNEKAKASIPSKVTAEDSTIMLPSGTMLVEVEKVGLNDRAAWPVLPEGKGKNYRIQVEKAAGMEEASQTARKLKSEGFRVYLKKDATSFEYFVYVGPFQELRSALINFKALKYSGRNPIMLSITKSG